VREREAAGWKARIGELEQAQQRARLAQNRK